MAANVGPRAFEKRFLTEIRPSYARGTRHQRVPYYPATCRTTEGRVYPHVIFFRESTIEESYCLDRLRSRLLSPLIVTEAMQSRERIPRRVVNRVNAQGETGHGGVCFILAMNDGRKVSCFGGTALGGEYDFLRLPSGFDPAEVKSVQFIRPLPPSDMAKAAPLSIEDMTYCLY